MSSRLVDIAKLIINSGAVKIRTEGPQFVYSSGNKGPGYVMIKGLCGQPEILKYLIKELSEKVYLETGGEIDFINGNVTGGMLPGWELRNQLSIMRNQEIPYVYLRGARKEGGHKELITGDMDNPLITPGMNVLIVEELVNYGETTLNAIKTFRESGYKVKYAACILEYGNLQAKERLASEGVTLISLLSLPQLLEIALNLNLLEKKGVLLYREYLENPTGWQKVDRIPKIFVALDSDTFGNCGIIHTLSKFNSNLYGFKINLDGILDGDKILEKVKSVNKPLFVDIKMWNGKRTMVAIVKKFVEFGVDIINVYAHVGEDILRELSLITRNTKTKLFVLTVLTHYDDDYCNLIYRRTMNETVRMFAEIADRAGADGIILPPTCLNTVQDLKLLKMCPGIRIDPSDRTNNQRQTSSVQNALENGADCLVIGTQITKADDMVVELKNICDMVCN